VTSPDPGHRPDGAILLAVTEVGQPIRSFVHQRNRLTAGQLRAWERWWPELGRDVGDRFDPEAWFGRRAPLVLEIGSGTGESTVLMAAAAPEVDHIAVEVFEPGLAQLLMRMAEAGVRNVVPIRGDAAVLLRDRVPDGSLAGIRIFFPDPWPKRRHHKRRLIQSSFVSLAACRLRRGGTLHLATDWEHYAQQMRRICDAEPMLDNLAAQEPGGWVPRPAWRPLTKFEERARVEHRVVRDMLYSRNITEQPSDHAT
jgi:tRNA (guanine-N7-)-methyltransferase